MKLKLKDHTHQLYLIIRAASKEWYLGGTWSGVDQERSSRGAHGRLLNDSYFRPFGPEIPLTIPYGSNQGPKSLYIILPLRP